MVVFTVRPQRLLFSDDEGGLHSGLGSSFGDERRFGRKEERSNRSWTQGWRIQVGFLCNGVQI